MSDLSAPLSPRRSRTASRLRPLRGGLPVARLAFAGIAVLVGAVVLRIVLVDTPDGGRPVAEVSINASQNANAIAGANTSANGGGVITVGPEIALNAVDSALAESAPATDAPDPAELDAFAISPDLAEETPYGPIPRISANGDTPFAAYSRPSVSAAAASGRPRIALVVSGLGINETGTLQAIERLPDTVTLAFAPYGKSLERAVGTARSEGHEVYLEVPLEPFDYPDNDPGPDTLLTGQAPRENMDRLYRVMSRFGGYAGIINNMGARFTASAADFGPMMEELGARGLAYLDDGSSNRSLAAQLTQANRVPFGRADLVIDTNPARAPILAALDDLETRARRDGQAMGLASALPVSIDAITEWAAGLEERGFLIVPASALMSR